MARMALLVAAVLVALGVGIGAQSPARAHDHHPPKTVLMKGPQELQRGSLGSYCWTSPAGSGMWVYKCQETTSGYPAADRVKAGSKLRIRFLKEQRPIDLSLVAHYETNKSGTATGKARRLTVRLRPVVEDGRTVAWDALFYVERRNRHYYLDAYGVWEDELGGPEQDASWTFHVRTTT